MNMNLNHLFESVQMASRSLSHLNDSIINQVLNSVAEAILYKASFILDENHKDLLLMDCNDPKYDRLLLSIERLEAIAGDIRKVASLPSPIGRTLKETVLPNGMKLSKKSVPFGVIGVIYESRPNVGLDVFSLCFKSGNACILKGGSEARFSNEAIITIIQEVLKQYDLSPNLVVMLPIDKDATLSMLHAREFIDLIIPRGGKGLINFVRDHATVPVIETGAGICHTYIDEFADILKSTSIIRNAKTRRVSVCNALDCVVIHEKRLGDLVEVCRPLAESNVMIYADSQSMNHLKDNYPSNLLVEATEESFGIEFLDYKMAVKTVGSIEEAIEHICRYSSKHSECILTENKEKAECFLKVVDAACVYWNASTAFTDGAQFGLGAEIGISTQKLHARGPMGLEELTSYKWVIEGDGQIRI